MYGCFETFNSTKNHSRQVILQAILPFQNVWFIPSFELWVRWLNWFLNTAFWKADFNFFLTNHNYPLFQVAILYLFKVQILFLTWSWQNFYCIIKYVYVLLHIFIWVLYFGAWTFQINFQQLILHQRNVHIN